MRKEKEKLKAVKRIPKGRTPHCRNVLLECERTSTNTTVRVFHAGKLMAKLTITDVSLRIKEVVRKVVSWGRMLFRHAQHIGLPRNYGTFTLGIDSCSHRPVWCPI